MKGKVIKILISLGISVALFIGLTSYQNKILKPNGTIKVFVANQDIGQGKEVDKEIDRLVKQKEIDKTLLTANAITSRQQLRGKISKSKIEKNEIISESQLIDKNLVLNKIKDKREISLKFTDIGQVVGGTIRQGDLIDISCIDNISKESNIILKNVYVDKVLSSDGRIIQDNETAAIDINIIISQKDTEILSSSLGKGNLIISKVI